MKKTIKIFGIGAAALFVLTTLIPVISTAQDPIPQIEWRGPYRSYEKAERVALAYLNHDMCHKVGIYEIDSLWYVKVYWDDVSGFITAC